MDWYPKRIKCPKCGKFAKFSRIAEGVPEYDCKCGEVIRWIMGKKFRKIPLPIKARYGNYYAVFGREPIPTFWRNTRYEQQHMVSDRMESDLHTEDQAVQAVCRWKADNG